MSTTPSSLLTYPTWRKHLILSSSISSITIKGKREIFGLMRKEKNHDAFMPRYGFTPGSFCVWQILAEPKRSRGKR